MITTRRHNRRLPAIAAFMTFSSAALHAAQPAAAALALHGDPHGIPPCASCHGQTGEGNAAAGIPRLAGLPDAYLAAQLAAMADGTRRSAVMEPVARTLSAQQRLELAQYYSELMPARAPGEPPAANPDDRLALQGRWSDRIPACVKCHGGGGSGVGAHFPALAGQPAPYMANQLRAWKQGTRGGDPLGLMHDIASRLTDVDIQAVSAYFAAQPVTGRSGVRQP